MILGIENHYLLPERALLPSRWDIFAAIMWLGVTFHHPFSISLFLKYGYSLISKAGRINSCKRHLLHINLDKRVCMYAIRFLAEVVLNNNNSGFELPLIHLRKAQLYRYFCFDLAAVLKTPELRNYHHCPLFKYVEKSSVHHFPLD